MKPAHSPPPSLYEKYGQKAIWLAAGLFLFIAILICLPYFEQTLHSFDEEYCSVYALLSLAGVLILWDRFRMNKSEIFDARLEDESYVSSLMEQAKIFCATKEGDEQSKKVEKLQAQVDRIETIGPAQWTEYQILPLDKKLTKFFEDSELMAKSAEKLTELNEYAQDSHSRYDMEQYYKWDANISNLIEELSSLNEKPEGNADMDARKAWVRKQLRSGYRSLLEHIASYKQDWHEGSTIIRNLLVCTISSVILFLIMGIVPLIYPVGSPSISIVHWGLLGSAGALTAVARDFRKTDLIAVGDTYGKRELWRAILGAVLGFIAGLVLWSLILGGLAKGPFIPKS